MVGRPSMRSRETGERPHAVYHDVRAHVTQAANWRWMKSRPRRSDPTSTVSSHCRSSATLRPATRGWTGTIGNPAASIMGWKRLPQDEK